MTTHVPVYILMRHEGDDCGDTLIAYYTNQADADADATRCNAVLTEAKALRRRTSEAAWAAFEATPTGRALNAHRAATKCRGTTCDVCMPLLVQRNIERDALSRAYMADLPELAYMATRAPVSKGRDDDSWYMAARFDVIAVAPGGAR